MTGEDVARRVREGGWFAVAVTHSSYAAEHATPDNQRLEFLGDAVLQLTVSDLLYRRYPDLDEGRLTRFRIALVRQESLARRGRALGLGRLLRVGNGREAARLAQRESVLCDTFEAVLGALFLEDGFAAARDFVAQQVEAELAVLGDTPWLVDPKAALAERLQAAGHPVPTYRVLGRSGPDHAPRFEVGAYDGDEELARGSGANKRAAEEAAAAAVLGRDGGEPLVRG